MIVIIDYGMCNIKSVANALDLLGADVMVSDKPEDIRSADRIILPGVGAFYEGMENLRKLGLIDVIKEEVMKNKKPLLGICLGMHLLAGKGFEGKQTPGFGLIPGVVKRFDLKEEFKIPHIGWNDVIQKKDHVLFSDLRHDRNFYFVHSYHLIPDSEDFIVTTTDYGGEFVSSVQKDNIFATQFHPEKSQTNGLNFLERFMEWEPDA